MIRRQTILAAALMLTTVVAVAAQPRWLATEAQRHRENQEIET